MICKSDYHFLGVAVIDLPAFDALALSLHHSPGAHAILVGSGLSRAAGIPTGWEITLNLIGRLGALEGVAESDDWAAWYHTKYNKEPSYSEILDTLASTQSERRAILESFIATGDDGDPRKPTKAHQAIAKLVASGAVRVVVTTNFDRLIEAALREAGVEPTVIASDDAIAGATPLVHSKCTVIKVHGDYLDARIKNTDAELADYSPAMNALLDQVFDNFGLLAVGWSGEWDSALRSAIQRTPSRRYPFYWAARGSVGPLAQDLIDQRGGRTFSIADADSFFVKLGETLEALKQASRPHPQSIEMALALARRYCRDDKFAMEWAAFLNDEVEKVRGFVTGPEYPQNQLTKETFNELIDLFISKTEVLRRSCLICGRWGTEDANKLVFRAIQSLSVAGEPQSGVNWNNELKEFGAGLAFYWNLAGLVDGNRWPLVYQIAHLELEASTKSNPAVFSLPPTSYGPEGWKHLFGQEKQLTPVSNFLFKHFCIDAIKDISVNEKQADVLFDRVELFISLEAAVVRLKLVQDTGLWFWVPFGRYLWKSWGANWLEAIAKYEALPDACPLYVAGLLGGSKSAAEPIFAAVKDFLPKVRQNWP